MKTVDDYLKKPIKKMNVLTFIMVVILSLALIYGGWWVERKVNYSLQYKAMVRETVKEMVKEEYLK